MVKRCGRCWQACAAGLAGVLVVGGLAACAVAPARVAAADPTLVDGFETPSPWRAIGSDQVSATLRTEPGVKGRALCLDYDFKGVSEIGRAHV